MEIRALRPEDDRSQFQSGDEDLDRFLRKYAGQNQFKHYLGVTYVAVEANGILGYATVSPGHVEIVELPATLQKKLPRYPLPVLRLARLAVDKNVRGRGLGAELLLFVFQLALSMAKDYGCTGIIVDAKPDAIQFYAKYGFIAIEAIEGSSNARPQPVPMFLPLRSLEQAQRPS